jgi:hypothetical protein
MPGIDRKINWQFLVTVHNRPSNEDVFKYGFIILRNDVVMYREAMSHDDVISAGETAQEQVLAMMEAEERYRDEKRNEKELQDRSVNSELLEREQGYRGEPKTPNKEDIQAALEKIGIAVPKAYRDIMATLDEQEAKLAEQGIPMKRVYLSDNAYDTLVAVVRQSTPRGDWWDRNPMGWVSRQSPDGKLYHSAKVYRLPDDLQHLDVVATFSDIQEMHDIIKIKQRMDQEEDDTAKPGDLDIDHPAWEFLEQRGLERHEPEPLLGREAGAPAPLLDWNDLLKHDISLGQEEDDDPDDGA